MLQKEEEEEEKIKLWQIVHECLQKIITRNSNLFIFIPNRSKTQKAGYMHSINVRVRFTSIEYAFGTYNVIPTTEDRVQPIKTTYNFPLIQRQTFNTLYIGPENSQ